MSEIPIRALGCNAKVPVISCEAKIADEAYAVFSALMRAANDAPSLRENSLWKFYVKQSYERFEIAFGVEQ